MDAFAHQSRSFLGVRFVLAGFRDFDYRRNVAEKLVGGGGVDVGRYGMDCTHVIVDGLVYDDPVCVAARKDGKTLVTGLWVEHSCDIGMAVDPMSIMYRPLKDMNGIPGATSLMVCLTGYQRQDRDDIMTMVRLMGAQFSKPLVATKVTHLICYKFEGEKYELAKKMMKIKLVNHQWLEDCLREWELLPESNYCGSGYELETEAEAKDSEEEEEDKFLKPCQENATKKSPILKLGMSLSSTSPVLKEQFVVSPPKGLTITDPEVPSHNEFPDLLVDGPKTSSLVGTDADAELLPLASNLQAELKTSWGNAGTPQPDAKFSTLSYSRRTSSMSVSPTGKDESGKSKKNLQEELPTTLSNAGTPQPDAKFSTLSYFRRTSSTSVSPPGKDESGNADFMKVNFSRSSDNVINNSFTETLDKVASGSYDVQTPSKTTKVCNAESKGKSVLQGEIEAYSAGCKLVKYSSPSAGSKFEESEVTVLMDKRSSGSSVMLNEMTSLHCVGLEKTHFSGSDPRKSSEGQRQIACDLPSTDITGVCSVVDKNDSKVTSHTSPRMLPHSISGLKHAIQGIDTEQTEYHSHEKPVQPQLTDCLSLRDQDSGIIAAFDVAKVNFAKGGKNRTEGSTERKMTHAKKTLGRKRNVPASANVKGSIYLTKSNTESDNMSSCDLRQEINVLDKSSNADRTEMPGHMGSALVTEEVDDTMLCKEVDKLVSHEMDDETEAPEEIGEPSRANAENESDRVNFIDKTDICGEEMSEITDMAVPHCSPSDKAVESPKQFASAAENPSRDQLLGGPKQFVKNLKNVKGSKRPLSTLQKVKGSKRPLSTRNLKGNQIEDDESLDGSSSRIVRRKIDKKQNNYKSSVQVEKENQPLENKSGRKKKSNKKECGEMNASMKAAATSSGNKTEPACFIMSGERQQRMQLRKVILGLKGKLCMDSHRWSYQATHFICTKPVRTEKWFAACASGRWILRPEYVSASNQEGKLLDEEPYEWNKTGLSQDGAINLEAPRKWRLLKQRTGHGALYDMRIIVYGECIAPPLETLKRAVKAGDGTILATSPPYTRFLNAKTDFAVISPGMPRVDAWIQEFLKHEIPCVVADYLVEYVCKPGYSLDKHILYNTHSWAERSFSRLQGKAEEVVGITATLNNEDSSSDIRCNICCLSDRKEVMLICGDEAGSVGCKTAAHIDCCNPQLEAVPKDYWFCPKCSNKGTKNARSTTARSRRKRRSR